MVLRTEPEDIDANFALGMWALESREYMGAVRHLQVVLRQKPNEPTVLNNLALAYYRQNFFTEAIEYAERAVKLMPSSEELKRNLANIRKAREEVAEKEREAAAAPVKPTPQAPEKSVLHEVIPPPGEKRGAR